MTREHDSGAAQGARRDRPHPAYRPGVGIMLVNAEGRVFAARRIDTEEEAWQMPQGGIDEGETPRRAALRELAEETGTANARLVAESAGWLSYDLPETLRAKLWGGRYRGQTQKWFLLQFTGRDSEIDITAHHTAEFDAWRWVDPEDLPRLIVGFKRAVYEAVLAEFRPQLSRLSRRS